MLVVCREGEGAPSGSPRRRPALFLFPQQAASPAGLFTKGRPEGQGELTWPLSGVGWRRPGCTGHEEGVSALWRLCPHSNLRSEITRQCPPLLLHPHLRAPLEVRNLPPTPMCLTQSKAAPPRGRGMARMPLEYQIDPLPSAAQVPQKSHLAEALLDPLGFCVAGSHGAADQAQVVPGLVHQPQESR